MNNGRISQEIEILRDYLSSEGSVGIVVGEHQTLDTMAAALSLYLSLTESGKQAQIISKKDPIVEISNLVGIDRVGKQFKGSTSQLVVSLPYSQGEIGKVSFKEEQGRINFNLSAAEGRSITPFDTTDIKLFWQGAAPEFVIAVGVAKVEELEGFGSTITRMVNIDNYPGNSRLGDVVLVDDDFSSLSEVVAKIISTLALPLDVDTAQNLMDGVSFATRNFTKPETSPLAFEAAGLLLAAGAIRKIEAPRVAQEQPRQQFAQPRQDRGEVNQQNPRPQQDRNQRDNRNRGNDNRSDRPRDNQRDSQQRFQPRNNQQGGGNFQPRPQQMPPVTQPVEEEIVTPNMQDIVEPQRMQSAPSVQQEYTQPKPQNMPEEQINPAIQSAEEVPNDWLVPKVFKGSKTQGDN